MSEGAQSTLCCCGGDGSGNGQTNPLWCEQLYAQMPETFAVSWMRLNRQTQEYGACADLQETRWEGAGMISKTRVNGIVVGFSGTISCVYTAIDQACRVVCAGAACQSDPPDQCGCQPCYGTNPCLRTVAGSTSTGTESPAVMCLSMACFGGINAPPADRKLKLQMDCATGCGCVGAALNFQLINLCPPEQTSYGSCCEFPPDSSWFAPASASPSFIGVNETNETTTPAGTAVSICYECVDPSNWYRVIFENEVDCGDYVQRTTFIDSISLI